jgi:hypothetical protein
MDLETDINDYNYYEDVGTKFYWGVK